MIKILHEREKVADHVIPDFRDEGPARGRGLDKNLASIGMGVKPANEFQFLEAIDQARGRGSGVPHAVGDLGHGQTLLLREKTEEEILGEGHIAAGQVLR